MKVGIAASMWRGLADKPFAEFVAYCKEAGADVIELSGWPDSYSKTLVLDEVGIEQVRQSGIGVVALACPSDLVQDQAEQVALIRRSVEIARKLGARVVALKAGNPLEGMSLGDAQARMVQTLRAVGKTNDVQLALENGGQLANDHTRLMAIASAADIRILPDTGNFLRFGYTADEVLSLLGELAPLAVHVHLKDGRGHRREFKDTPLGEGELDCERMLAMFRHLPAVCVQYEGPDQPSVYARNVSWVKQRV